MPRTKAKRNKPVAVKRRARGTGSIMWDKRRHCYLARVIVGKLANGRTRYKEVRAKTQEGVVEKMKLVAPAGPEVTVKEWSERWVTALDVRPSTRAGYVRQVDDRIVPQLGHQRVADLTISHVKAALVIWRGAGTATANRTLAVAANMLNDALLENLIARNPFADCPRLRHEPKELDPFTVAELKAVIGAHAGAYTVCPVLAFLAATGVRIGEAAALDVADYDPATGKVSISKTWSRDHGTRAPKSKHSRRTITTPAQIRPALAAAVAGRTSGVMFRSASGERFDSAQLHVGLNRLLKSLGLRRRNPHAIRHGVATALVSRGVPLGDAARYLGHTVAQLVRTYVQATGSDPAEALAAALA